MDDAAVTKYLAEDFANALKFYDSRANSSKMMYRVLSIYLIVVSALLIPVLAFAPMTDGFTGWRIAATFLSGSLVVATGLLSHFKCHENWLSYRATWDSLQRERRLHDAGVGHYKVTDKHAVFVERVEQILSREATDFYARHAKGEEQAKEPKKTTRIHLI